MKSKTKEETLDVQEEGWSIDAEHEKETLVEKPIVSQKMSQSTNDAPGKYRSMNDSTLINCLRNERIIVRSIPKHSIVSDPKHILFGKMSPDAKRMFVVPTTANGNYEQVLTASEQAYLEDIMGLEKGSMSIFRKENNFWDDTTEFGVSKVTLTKGDNYLDLSNPEDFIKYKILLTNKNFICPSHDELKRKPKESYLFEIVRQDEENNDAASNMNVTTQCYLEYGKISENFDLLREIVDELNNRPTSANVKLSWIQGEINNIIQSNPQKFMNVIKDPLLGTKVLIKKCNEAGLISKRGDFYYLKSDGSPLCDDGQDPTLPVAARYLNMPRHQELMFNLESKLK